MEYSISIQELLKRPIIRSDKAFEWENKMTDDELKTFDSEVNQNFKESMDIDFAIYYTTKTIDREILYRVFKLGNKNRSMV